MALNILNFRETFLSGFKSTRISFEALEERIVLDGAVDDVSADADDFGDVAAATKSAGMVNPAIDSVNDPTRSAVVGSDIYYVAPIDEAGWDYNMRLWKYTPGVGATALLDLPYDGSTGSWSNDVSDIFSWGTTIYLVFSNGDGVYGLWEYDEVGNTVTMIKDLIPDNDTQVINAGTERVIGFLYYAVDDLLTGGGGQAELYRYSFWDDSIAIVDDISPWTGSQIAWNLTFNWMTLNWNFIVYDGSTSSDLYARDVYGNVSKVMDLPADAWPNNVDNLEYYDGKLYFQGYDATNGRELWAYTASTNTVELVEDVNPGSGSSNPGAFMWTSSGMYFFADDDGDGDYDLFLYT